MGISKENSKIVNKFLKYLLVIIILLSIAGCSVFQKNNKSVGYSGLVKLSPGDYPKFSDDLFFDSLGRSIDQSLAYYDKMPASKQFLFGTDLYDTNHMIETLSRFKAFITNDPSKELLNQFVRDNFEVYKSIGNSETGEVLFTGYYEPSLWGSLKESEKYKYPVFAQPDDHVIINLRKFSDNPAFKRSIVGRSTGENSVVPYYTRSEIGTGEILKSKAEVLAYVDNLVDLFFLEIQGSGIIHLDNGEDIRVHYHTKNGHSYKSIGAYLIRNNSIPREEISMQSIRQYLDAHPEEVTDILNYNTSYVFFRLEEGGPYGCYNAAVTPERSIATDKKEFPACALSFIRTQKPLVDGDANIDTWADFGRFVLNQDTGGAIKGAGRADLFKGNGEYAEIAAGHMKHPGEIFFLVLKKSQ